MGRRCLLGAINMYKMIYALLVMLSLTSFYAQSNEPSLPELSIISINLPPLQYYNEKNQLEGYFVDIVQAAMATTKFPYEMHLYPWARSYSLAQTKKNHCIFSLNRIPEREKLFTWIVQLAETHSAIYSLKKRNITISSLEEAKAYTVAAIRNGVYHQILIRNGFKENKNIYVVSDSDSLVKLFHSKTQIDLIFSDDIVLNRHADRLNLNTDEFERQFYLNHPPLKDYFACSPQTSTKVIDLVSDGFKNIRKNGVLNEINKKWRSKLGAAIID
jgi:polar amino acid transport system substrate-binding protein